MRSARSTGHSARSGVPVDVRVTWPPGLERVFSKRQLLREIWGYRSQARTRTLDAHLCRLRK
jgi:hypothetical protein